MVMPNFLVIGAAKAGTTSLYEYLKQHPQIWMSPVKETNFFALEGEKLNFCGPGDQEYINRFSITKIEDYLNVFQGVSNQVAIGEVSPLYLYSPKAPERIKHYTPDMKIIIILRNPVDRAYSSFLHLIRDGREQIRNFAQALQEEEERIRSNWEHIWHYKQLGFYYVQLNRYFNTFYKQQVRVYLFEDLIYKPIFMLKDIFQFLGVNEEVIPDISVKHNVSVISKDKAPTELLLGLQLRRQLVEVYREDISKLQHLLQQDLSKWLE